MTRTTHSGSCHCGDVTFEVDVDFASFVVLDCNCSICRRKGFLHVIVPRDQFRLLSGRDCLREYRFGTGVAVHRFCETCGIHPFYTPRSHPDSVDVNARCLDVDLDTLRVEPFDGDNWEETVDSIR